MTNFDTAREALDTSLNSAGSAMAEHEKWQKSLEARILSLKASWQSLSQSFLQSDFLKGAIGAITKLVDALDWLIDKIGAVPTLIGTFAGISSLFKDKGAFTFDKQTKSVQLFGNALSDLKGNYQKISTGITTYNSNLTKSTGLQNAYVNALSKQNSGLGKYLSGLKGAKASFGGYISSLVGATVKTVALEAATMALNTALTMGVSALISFGVKAISKFIDGIHQSREELKEMANEIRDNYQSTSEQISSSLDSIYGVEDEFERLSRGVSIYGENISLTSDEYERYKSIVEEIVATNPLLVKGYDDEGNAIADKNTLIEESIALLKEQQRLELQSYVTDDKIKTLGKDVVEDIKDYRKENPLPYGNAKWDFQNKFADAVARYDADTEFKDVYDIMHALNFKGWNWSDYSGSDRIKSANFASDFYEQIVKDLRSEESILRDYFTSSEINDLLNIANNYDKNIATYNAEISKLGEGFNSTLQLVAQAQKGYSDLSDTQKAFVSSYINGFKITGDTSEKQLLDMKYQIQDFVDLIVDNKDVGKSINELFTLDILDLNSIDERTSKINSLAESISSVEGIGISKQEIISAALRNISSQAVFNLQTQLNGGEITCGEYIQSLQDVESLIDGFDIDDEVKSELKLALNTDEVKAQYNSMREYLQQLIPEITSKDPRGKSAYLTPLKNEIETFLKGLTADELAAVVDIRTEIDWENTSAEDIRKQIEDRVKLNEALNFSASIEVDKTALEALNTALEESASAMGLSEESIDSLKAKYSDLEGYNPHTLFEKTANGVKVNREELAKLEQKYNDLTKTEVQEHLDTLVDEYNKCTKAIDGNIGSQEKLELISKREKYAQQIEELAEYKAQLEGVTGAYQKWIDAQNTPQEYEGYQAVATSREDIKEEIDRGFISSATKEYIDLLSGKDLTGGTIDDYAEAWEKLDQKVGSTSYSINDFFTVNEDGDITSTGIHRFFDGIQKDFKGEVYKLNEETGEWYYDFSEKNLKEIQNQWGVGIEAIELILEAAEAAGYNIDWGGMFDDLDLDVSNFESVEAMISLAEKAQEEFNKLKGVEDVEFNFRTNNIEDATTEVEKARKAYLDLITNKDGSLNLKAEGAEQMQFILATLLTQKQQLSTPAIMKVDTSQIDKAETDIIDVINKAKSLQTAYENYEIAITTGVDVEGAKKDLNSAIDGMKGASVDVRADLKLPTNEELEAAKGSIGDIKVGASLDGTSIGAIATKIQTECTPEVIAKVTGLDETAIQNGSQQVVYTAEHSDVDNFINSLSDISKKIIYTYTTEGSKPNPSNINRTITYEYKTEGDVPEAYGTAHSNGTAFARGNWGIKGSGVALGGELGRELVVRDGKFFTIGDEGAQFFHYKPNDIIFNAAQTESLFKYGGIKGANPRGKVYAEGSAFASGSYPSSGEAFWQATATTSKFAVSLREEGGVKKSSSKDKKDKKDKDEVKIVIKDDEDEKTPFNATANKGGTFADKNSQELEEKNKSEDKFEETIDWIETILDRAERAIDKYEKQSNNVYRTWAKRNKALESEIAEVTNTRSLYEQAEAKYLSEANGVGLSESYAKKVRNGTLSVEDFKGESDEKLVEKIKEYQKWYEKVLDCQDAIEELKEKEASLYAQRVENVAAQYEGILSVIEHEKNMLEEYISQSEAQAWLVSANYYNALADNEKDNIAQLKKEKNAMLSELQAAMESGTIDKYSESWYEMVNAVDEVTLAITEGETRLKEYSQTIQQLSWETFDLLQDKISAITEETDFLIELLSNDKLYDDNGQLTDSGMATMGQHGVAYNTHMYQADLAAKEAERLRKELSEDPFDVELENRYREMISLQQEHILAAEGEKEAIRDMVEEGINLELDALQELIDKHNEELDSVKDLYDYQNKVKEQTKEIASLEKQIAAYNGDTSEEAQSKIQELKVSLEEAKTNLQEAEYDKYISDSQRMLDELYLSYEEILNTRLDNLDALVSDVITEVNANATTISTTLSEKADSVGYTLSESMKTIWNSSDLTGVDGVTGVITTYGKNFVDAQTTTNTALGVINTNLQSMITQLNKVAKTNIKSASISSTANSEQADIPKKETDKNSNNTNTSNTIKVGGKINAKGAQIYDYAGDKSGERQLYRNDPIYKVLKTNGNWLQVRWHKLSKGITGWFKKGDVKAYATGKKNFLDDEMAWTQEKGQEFIIRPSDGAILTPIAKRDSILNAQASNNIWDMANSPAEFIKENLSFGVSNMPNNSNAQNVYHQNLEKVVISLPNVHNYNEFLSEMQKDKNFKRLIESMTINQIAGKSSLGVNKSIR